MPELPIYINHSKLLVAPRFANFCRGFRGATVSELYVYDDGSGLFLRADHNSIRLHYRSNSLDIVGFAVREGDVPFGPIYMYPTGKEPASRKYFDGEEFLAKETTVDGINSVLAHAREGKIVNAIVDFDRAKPTSRYAGGLGLPEDTPFFYPDSIRIGTTTHQDTMDFCVLYFEEETFIRAECLTDEHETIYIPTEVDR